MNILWILEKTLSVISITTQLVVLRYLKKYHNEND